jgi:glycosidase
MNKQAIQHLVDSPYSYGVGGTKFHLVVRTAKDDDIKTINCLWNSYCHFYQTRNVTPLTKDCSDHLYDYYSCDIDNGDPAYAYVFEITETNDEKTTLTETGLTKKYVFSTCFLDEFMACYPNDSDLVKDNPDFQGRLFYQIFPERFARGSKESKAAYMNMNWDTDHPDNDHFAGGDFKGIMEKIPYLKSLGVGAIYLNPIHPSPSAHKYDINDYKAVDPMFGTLQDFIDLVRLAHSFDIKVVMDMVFNHCCFYNFLFQDVVKKGKKSPYYNWFFIQGDKPTWDKKNYLTFADVRMMPKLNTNNPAVQDYLASVGEYWIKEADVDGYRLDVAFEVSHSFWRFFKERCCKLKPSIVLIGEHWLNSESHLSRAEWESTMNYPFMVSLQHYFRDNEDEAWLADDLNRLLVRYKDANNRMMMNLLDSHDTERFFTFLKEDRDEYLASIAMLMFYPGWPCIYYGDEIFMNGGGDPLCRKPMKWKSNEFTSNDGKAFQALLKLREDDILKKGSYKVSSKDGVLLISRAYEGHGLVLCVAKDAKKLSKLNQNIILKRVSPHSTCSYMVLHF